MTNVTIPATVDSIGEGAFKGCENLSEVKLPENLTTIGGSTFEGCENLKDVTIPENVTAIGENAFAGAGLTNVTIPESVDSIGAGAFNCPDMTEIVLTDGTDPVRISDDAFGENYTDVHMGRPVDGTPFAGGPAENVKIGNTIENIPDGFFAGCENLSEVVIGGSVTEIGQSAFADCPSLKAIVLPPSTTTIAESAFANSGLENIVIGPNVTAIGHKAFSGVSAATVSVTAIVPPVMESDAFSSYSATLRVHDLKVAEAYAAANGWKAFSDVDELVKPSAIKVEGVDKLTGAKGSQIALKATLVAPDGQEISLPHIFWHSTNPELATVDHNGVVTLKADISEDGVRKAASLKADSNPALTIVAETLYANGPLFTYDPVTGKTSRIEDVIRDFIPDGFDPQMPFEIYDLKGALISSSLNDLLPGYYIIRQNNITFKIKR